MIDWQNVRRVLIVRLRSIGDTVLSTPSLIAMKQFRPDIRVDILLEDWVAPLLEGFEDSDEVIAVGSGTSARLRTAWQLRRNRYDVAFNLHGGTTGTFFTYASGAPHRVGYAEYQYPFLYNHLVSSSADFWQREFTHSAEQQLALLGVAGVPVRHRPKSRLTVTKLAADSVQTRLDTRTISGRKLALIHPAAAFETKQWPVANFARTAENLADLGLTIVAVAAKSELALLESLKRECSARIETFGDLSLPEITALASRSDVFVGNDSGIAHIAAAVGTPTVVIFGSSNVNHWRPWTDAPNAVVREELPCQPCAGYECKEFGEPRCIRNVPVAAVVSAAEKVLGQK